MICLEAWLCHSLSKYTMQDVKCQVQTGFFRKKLMCGAEVNCIQMIFIL